MPRFPNPPEGSWTQHYPDLGTGLVSYEDSISREFFELERVAIFERAWLNIGRIEQLPREGSYFTKELAVGEGLADSQQQVTPASSIPGRSPTSRSSPTS